MKKRSKKYNPRKWAELIADTQARKHIIAFVGTKEPQLLNEKGKPVRMSKAASQVLLEFMQHRRHHWSVYIACMLRDHTNREYIQSEQLTIKTPLLSSEISDYVNDAMRDLTNRQVNKNHLVNIGWIARPMVMDFEDTFCDKIFTEMGAFEFVAKWEIKDLDEQDYVSVNIE